MSLALGKFDLLREFTADELEQLAEFFEEVSHEDGRTLYHEGDEAAALILLREGYVALEARDEPLGEIAPGAALGLMSLVHIGKRVCTARATAPLQTFVLTRESYLRMRADCPALALLLQEGMARALAAVVHELERTRHPSA